MNNRCFSRVDLHEAVEKEVAIKDAEIVELRRLLRQRDERRLEDVRPNACSTHKGGEGSEGKRGHDQSGSSGEVGDRDAVGKSIKAELDLLRNILTEMQVIGGTCVLGSRL